MRNRHAKAHAWITGAYLGTHAVGYWGQATAPRLVGGWNEWLAAAWLACLLAWLRWLRAPAAITPVTAEEALAVERRGAELDRFLDRI